MQHPELHTHNIAELVEMIREIGGTAVAFTEEDAAAFAIRLAYRRWRQCTL
jgi:hypothetical protein